MSEKTVKLTDVLATIGPFMRCLKYGTVSDLNDMNQFCIAHTTTEVLNLPPGVSVGLACPVIYLAFDHHSGTQIFIHWGRLDIYIRRKQSGTWSSWSKVNTTTLT